MQKNPYKGKLITFEGLDGSGLTTQAELLMDWITETTRGQVLAYLTKEPTDGPAGGQIRLGLAQRLEIDEEALALLFAADRMDHLNRCIIPRLKDGIHVICDRYYLSSFAYQSLKVPFEWLKQINNRCIRPDLTIVLKVPPSICVRRMAKERFGVARYEYEPQLQEVWRKYLEIIPKLREEGERIEIIDGNDPIQIVHHKVVRLVQEVIPVLKSNAWQPRLLG